MNFSKFDIKDIQSFQEPDNLTEIRSTFVKNIFNIYLAYLHSFITVSPMLKKTYEDHFKKNLKNLSFDDILQLIDISLVKRKKKRLWSLIRRFRGFEVLLIFMIRKQYLTKIAFLEEYKYILDILDSNALLLSKYYYDDDITVVL